MCSTLHDVSVDRQRFLLGLYPELKPSEPLTLIQNWTAHLRER
jgi:hypothetical protein